MEYNIRFTLDSELKQNFTELNKYIMNSDYFNSTDDEIKKKYKTRIDDIKKGEELGDTGMNILEIPARRVMVTTKKDYEIKCPLCLNPQVDKTIYPYNLEKLLLWRGYLIKPNTFPYFKLHYLIQSSDHLEGTDRGTQNEIHKNPNTIQDMLDFSKLMKDGTLLFNGWVGNSLGHFHLHYTDTHFPIKTKFKKYSFDKDIIKSKNGSLINIYKDSKHNCKNFILIKGPGPGSDVFQLLEYLNSIKLFYNLLIYRNKDIFYVFVFIRRKEQDELNFNFGSAHMSGLSTFSDNNLKLYNNNKKDFLKIIDNYCSKTLVKIDEDMIRKLFF
jgi:hypothetical protein